MQRHLCALIAAVALCGACATPQDNAVFVTKTSLSLIDVDSAPPSVSIAYDRTEGYVGPRFDDGSVMPVAGYFDTDGAVFNRKVRQVYATGRAATIATAASAPASAPSAPASAPGRTVMFFGTNTAIGLKIGFSEGTPLPTSFLFGYRRKEASIIPVEKGRYTSVVATLDNTYDASKTGTQAQTDFGVVQYFATGDAADAIAGKSYVRQAFEDRAKQALTGVVKFRSQEAEQGKAALDTLLCLARIPDNRLDRVWNNAEDVGVFATSGITGSLARIRAAPPGARQRETYTAELGVLNADSAEHTQAMLTHKASVCRLATP